MTTTENRVEPLAEAAVRSNSNHNNRFAPGENVEMVMSERAQYRADQIDLIRTKLATSTDGHLDRAADLLLQTPGGVTARMPDIEFAQFRRSVGQATQHATLSRELAGLESEYRSRVTIAEVDPYAEGSPHSWLVDTLTEQGDGGMSLARNDDGGRADRLQRHGSLVVRSLERNDEYGQAITRSLEAAHRPLQNRADHPESVGARKMARDELRAISTGGGITASASGGGAAAFVTPAILLKAFSTYRSPFASFISQLDDSLPLPAYGLEVAVPQITGPAQVSTTTENQGTPETDPTFGLLTSTVAERSGQITISQAILDRVGPGIAGDMVMYRQLREQLDASFDLYALTTALTNAQNVTGISSFTVSGTSGVGGFTGDLRKAKRLLTNTAGVRLRATHAFAPDDLIDYVLAWGDAQGRPIATPNFDDSRAPIKSAGDSTAQGYSGMVLSGLALFGDSNIPNYGTTSQEQIVVCRGDSVYWLPGAPIFMTMPSGSSASFLDAIVAVRSYAACIPKWPTGIAAITGTGYTASTFA